MPPSPGHFWANSVTAAPCGQKKHARANSHSHSVTGPEAEMAGIRFRLATATTKSSTRSRRPSTRSRRGFLPVGSGRIALPSDEGAGRSAGPDFEGTREHSSLSIAHREGDRRNGSGALHERFGKSTTLVADQAAEAGVFLSEAAWKRTGGEAELLSYGGQAQRAGTQAAGDQVVDAAGEALGCPALPSPGR